MPRPHMMRRKRRVPAAQQRANRNMIFDYKDPKTLSRFIQENGAILARDITGISQQQQRDLARQIKRARHLALLPFTQTL